VDNDDDDERNSVKDESGRNIDMAAVSTIQKKTIFTIHDSVYYYWRETKRQPVIEGNKRQGFHLSAPKGKVRSP
jgi:hypothetical protein